MIRKPVQARAFARRDALLDATARVLDRGGFSELTTNAVAAEADASIGTVYQYFPDKEALLAGLLERHQQRLAEAIDGALVGDDDDPLAIGDRAVDAFARVWRSEPGYRAAWAASQAASLVDRTGAAWSRDFTARIELVVGALLPQLSERERHVVAVTTVHLVSGLLLVAMTHPPTLEAELVRETKLALRAYLSARLSAGARGADRRSSAPRGRRRRARSS